MREMEILLYYISRGEQITRKQGQEGSVNYFETRQMVDCDLSSYLLVGVARSRLVIRMSVTAEILLPKSLCCGCVQFKPRPS